MVHLTQEARDKIKRYSKSPTKFEVECRNNLLKDVAQRMGKKEEYLKKLENKIDFMK